MTHISTILCRRYARGELDDIDDLYRPDEDVAEKLEAIKQRQQNEIDRNESDTKDGGTNLAFTEKLQSKNGAWGNIKAFFRKVVPPPAGRGFDLWGRASKVNKFSGIVGPGRMLTG